MLVSCVVFLGVATMVESCVHVGGLLMLVSILSLLLLPQSSTLVALTSKPTLEPESRLIDGLGSLGRKVGWGVSFPLSSVGLLSGGSGGLVGMPLG